jgi:adenosylcobinamide-phosphate synthase
MNLYLLFWLLSPLIALLLNRLIGDPLAAPVVRLIGRLAQQLQKIVRPQGENTPEQLRKAGKTLLILVCSITFLSVAVLLALARLIHPWAALVLHWILAAQLFACHRTAKGALSIKKALEEGDGEAARARLTAWAGSEVSVADSSEIIRETVNGVVENLIHGVVAPGFWMLFGGVPLMAVYQAIHVVNALKLHSTDFGSAAAVSEEVMSFLPAQCAAFLAPAAAACLPGLSGKQALSTFKKERSDHPNPDVSEVFAGALGLRADTIPAGVGGEPSRKVPLSDVAVQSLEPLLITRSVRLMMGTSLLFAFCAVILLLIGGFLSNELWIFPK